MPENPSAKELFQFIDLTSLNSRDTLRDIELFANQALAYDKKGYTVAAVCVYPNFASIVKNILKDTSVKTAVVGACFPASQSFLEVKKLECELAVKNGAQEVDVVINIGALLEGNDQAVVNEIQQLKARIGSAKLKVIIESGLLNEPALIHKATVLSIQGGADFVKTSTGKVPIGATPEAAEIICKAIHDHHQKTGIKIGFKVSGGVRTYEEAVMYYNCVKTHLGDSFLSPDYFRIGASSLAEALFNA